MTLPKLPESEEEKWQSNSNSNPPYSPLRQFSLSRISHKQILIIPSILLIFTLGYILAFIRITPYPYLPGGSQFRQPLFSDPPIPPIITSLDSSSHPSILIFQHFSFHDSRLFQLQNESIAQHERYARYWGYGYIRSFDNYVPVKGRTTRQKQMNKLYALLKVVLGEVEKGDKGVEWIMITDADTLIIDPIIPIHSLLPPFDLDKDSQPLIIGTEDHNGFNSGSMIYRIGLDLVAFLSRVIVLSEDITWDYNHPDSSSSSSTKEVEKEIPPSDQRALCLTIQNNPITSGKYYPYPQEWLNSYSLPNNPNDDQSILLQIHLVNRLKYTKDLSEELGVAREAWRRLALKGPEEVQERVLEIEGRARRYWETVLPGPPRCLLI